MLRTDTERLIRAGKRLSGKTWYDVSQAIGSRPSNVMSAIKRKQFNKRFILIAEALGYDIDVRLVPRGKE